VTVAGEPQRPHRLLRRERQEELGDRDPRDRRAARGVVVEADGEPSDHGERPSLTAPAMMSGNRRTSTLAVGGEPISSPNTSSVPIASNDATIAVANRTMSATWASVGRSPSVAACRRCTRAPGTAATARPKPRRGRPPPPPPDPAARGKRIDKVEDVLDLGD
jgi:hypothetical protein